MAIFLNDFLPDSNPNGDVQEVTIGLDNPKMGMPASLFSLIEPADIKNIFKPRAAFSHKGTYGHALIIAGASETMGAALLASKGCLYGGAGLTTAAIPESGLSALNAVLPEVMYLNHNKIVNSLALDKYNAIAIGPGLAKIISSKLIIKEIINLKSTLIMDAEALNILSENRKLLSILPKDTILTPHVKEFDNLFGAHKNWWERLQTARENAKNMGIVIVLKNQYTFIIDQLGNACINPTGNPAMAQGGMGDVLTGLIAAYVAQGYSSKEAAILGCYFHGKAGDELAAHHFNVTASQVAEQVPAAIKSFLD